MIIDYREGRGIPPAGEGLADKETGIVLSVFYYDTKTHLCGRLLRDFDGKILCTEAGGVHVWEKRELAFVQRKPPAGPTIARILPPGALRTGGDRTPPEVPPVPLIVAGCAAEPPPRP